MRKFRLIGPVDNTGIGTHLRNISSHLPSDSTFNFEVLSRYSQTSIADSKRSSSADDVNIFFLLEGQPRDFKGINVAWYVYDLTRLPEGDPEKLLSDYDRIWAPSEWERQILLQNNIPFGRITVVPEGVAPDVYFPADPRGRPDAFRILQVGKFETRKSYVESSLAIQKAFGGDDSVEFLAKCDWVSPSRTVVHPDTQRVLSQSQVKSTLITGSTSDAEMAALYNAADVFLFPSKGEGWGLPLIEALACGIPCIATCYSGQSEYLSAVEGLYMPIDFTLGPMDCPENQARYPRSDNDWGLWARPSVDDIAAKLIEVRANYPLWKERALRASEIIRREFSWERAAAKAVAELEKIAAGS